MFEKIFSGLGKFLADLGLNLQKVSEQGEILEKKENRADDDKNKEVFEIHSVWDYLKFQDNSQAFHVSKVIGFEEWLTMDEIRRRVFDLFGIEYKNSKSLYPYIKTLVDCGLFEVTAIGGKRKWRKKDLIIKIKEKKAKKEAEEIMKAQVS
jgi:hypothetical protein